MAEHAREPVHTRRHGRVVGYLLGLGATLLALILIVVVVAAVVITDRTVTTDRRQSGLAPFYLAPSGWQDKAPGTLLRSEPLGVTLTNASAWRVLYVTTTSDGSKAVSSGMVFAPKDNGSLVAHLRPVVAWAHPTIGMGVSCAPSRSANPTGDVQGLSMFLSAGWVVTATDYAGLGTRGTEEYLVGRSEAADLLNSVRAARQIPETEAGTQVGLWGHSQGGHAVLWAEALAPQLTPELQIVGAAAAAPAAALDVLIPRLWNTDAGSVVGLEVLRGYPAAYPDLNPNVVSNWPQARIARVANQCLLLGALDVVISDLIGLGHPLRMNPMTNASWAQALNLNVPPTPSVPTYVVQGMDDPLVLPGSTSHFLEAACTAHAPVSWAYIGALGHMKAGQAGAPSAFTFLQQRFDGLSAPSDCGTELPVPALG